MTSKRGMHIEGCARAKVRALTAAVLLNGLWVSSSGACFVESAREGEAGAALETCADLTDLVAHETKTIGLPDGARVEYALSAFGTGRPVPIDPRGCWSPCTDHDLWNWERWRSANASEYRLRIRNLGARFTHADYRVRLHCFYAGPASGRLLIPGYLSADEFHSGEVALAAEQEVAIELRCTDDKRGDRGRWVDRAVVSIGYRTGATLDSG